MSSPIIAPTSPTTSPNRQPISIVSPDPSTTIISVDLDFNNSLVFDIKQQIEIERKNIASLNKRICCLGSTLGVLIVGVATLGCYLISTMNKGQ